MSSVCPSESNQTLTGGCRQYYDGLLCWPNAEAETEVMISCPPLLNGITYHGNATKYCNANGTFSKSNYTDCKPDWEYLQKIIFSNAALEWHNKVIYNLYITLNAVSLLLLFAALAIFASYRNFRTLHCLRNFIHVNLLACYTVYDAMWLLFALIGSLLKHEIEQYESYRLCVAISIIMKYFLTASFFWMMVEGAYLLIGVMFSFHLQRIRYWWTLLFGWGIPSVLVGVSTGIYLKDEGACMQKGFTADYVFLIPIIIVIVTNTVILGVIIGVIFVKLRSTTYGEANRYRRTARGLVILCPLLGVNYLLAVFTPTSPLWLRISLMYFTAIISSTQGILVAILFCFMNHEVIQVLKQSYKARVVQHRTRSEALYRPLHASTAPVSTPETIISEVAPSMTVSLL